MKMKTPSVFGCAESTFPAGAGKERGKEDTEWKTPSVRCADTSPVRTGEEIIRVSWRWRLRLCRRVCP